LYILFQENIKIVKMIYQEIQLELKNLLILLLLLEILLIQLAILLVQLKIQLAQLMRSNLSMQCWL
jgi:hypothetical protein